MSIPTPARDPDGPFRHEEALRPDPIAMTARSMLGSGLLGSLLDRIDRALETREERRFTLAAGANAARKPAGIATGGVTPSAGPETP